MSLTHERVHRIRTVPKTDRYYGALYRVTTGSVRDARVGITWKTHETPPDIKSRVRTGNWGEL